MKVGDLVRILLAVYCAGQLILAVPVPDPVQSQSCAETVAGLDCFKAVMVRYACKLSSQNYACARNFFYLLQ